MIPVAMTNAAAKVESPLIMGASSTATGAVTDFILIEARMTCGKSNSLATITAMTSVDNEPRASPMEAGNRLSISVRRFL